MTEFLQVGGSILGVATFLIALEFMVAYHRKTRGAWRGLQMGRHVMVFTAAIAAVFGLATTRFLLVDVLGHDDVMWFRALRLAVFTSIPAVLIWRRVLLFQAQREKSKT